MTDRYKLDIPRTKTDQRHQRRIPDCDLYVQTQITQRIGGGRYGKI